LLVLFGYTWALFQHMLGGVRHLIWDTGRGFDLDTVDRMCWFSFIGSVSLTVLVWAAILFS
jgi:succinate dehydrogenase / fumarate reductase cytochrome b subunit